MLSKKKKMKSKSALRNTKSSNSDDRIIKWILPAPDPTPYVNIQNYVSDGGYSLPSKGPIFNIITKVDQQHGEKRRVLANILQNTNMGNMDYKRGEGNLLPQNILSCDVSNMNVKPDAAFMPPVTFPTSKMSNIIDQRERGGMLPHDLKRSNISAKIDAGYFLSETFLTSNMIGQTNEIKKSRILPVILKNCNTRNMTDHTAGAGMLLDNPKKSDVINLDSKIKSECTFPGFMPASNNSNENGKVEEEWVFPEFYPASYKKNRENNTNAEFVSSEHLDDKANCGWAFSEFVPASQKKKPNEKSEEEWVCPEFYPASYKSNQDKKLDIPERVPAFAISSVNDKTTGGLMFPDLISPSKTSRLSEHNKQGFILPHPNISSTMSNFPNATSNLNTAYQNSINAGIPRNMNNELPNINTGYVSPEAEYTFQWSNVA